MYQVQFYPNRIVTTWKNEKRFGDGCISIIDKLYKREQRRKSNINLKKSKTSVNLSASSKRNIRDSINGMYILSKPRTIKLPNNKIIYNYRQSFITLTLPSEQLHSDIEIKKCLNNFLTSLRSSIGVKNYVWKAELQKNENIHFHLVVDKYCSYQAIRHYWNKAINKLGYVDRYSERFNKLSLPEYCKLRGISIEQGVKPYNNGKLSKWESPNSVDVVSVRTDKDVSNYLSKYFAKSDETNLDVERIKNFGRVWSRSQSLSQLKYINKFTLSEINDYLKNLISSKSGIYKKTYDFCSIIYLSLSKVKKSLYNFFEHILISNAKRYNYPFPAT